MPSAAEVAATAKSPDTAPNHTSSHSKALLGAVAAVLALLVIAGLLTTLLANPIRLDQTHLWLFLGATLGFAITTFAFQLPFFSQRRGQIQVLISSILVAVLCVFASRILHLIPAYLYGLVCLYIVKPEPSDETTGRLTAKAVSLTIVLTLAALGLNVLANGAILNSVNPSPMLIIIQATLVTVCTAGLGMLAFGLLPLPFLPGQKIAKWNRHVWLVLFVIGCAAFLSVLVVPEVNRPFSEPWRSLLPASITFAVFMVLSAFVIYYFHRHKGDGRAEQDKKQVSLIEAHEVGVNVKAPETQAST